MTKKAVSKSADTAAVKPVAKKVGKLTKTASKKAAKPAAKPLAKKASAPAMKKAAKPVAKKKAVAATPGGLYTAPRGNVSIIVPAFWTLQQTNDDLVVESPGGKTSVIVTAYQKSGEVQALDARVYLHHYFETAPHKGRFTELEHGKQRASARYRDEEGNSWEVLFLSNGETLLLSTLSTSGTLAGKEGKVGQAVLASLKLQGVR